MRSISIKEVLENTVKNYGNNIVKNSIVSILKNEYKYRFCGLP